MTEPGFEIGNVDCKGLRSLHLPSNMDPGVLTFSFLVLAYATVQLLA